MFEWSDPFGGYVDWLTVGEEFFFLPQLRIDFPNGGEQIAAGSTIPFKFYTAGLQGSVVEIGFASKSEGLVHYFVEKEIAAAGEGEDEFNKSTTINVTLEGNMPAGDEYKFIVRVKLGENWYLEDLCDDWFSVVPQ